MVRIGRGGAIILSMSTSTTALVTVEELRRMEDPPGFRLELHNGEVVKVGRPKPKHWFLQQRIVELFRTALERRGVAGTEYAFRCEPEFDLRVADVAWVSHTRLRTTDLSGDFEVPEIVVEVLSPSNTTAEMMETKELCLSAGCEEFWIVDPKREVIEVTRATGPTLFYHRGSRIPVAESSWAVDQIFEPEEL